MTIKGRISSPLEAGPSILDAHHLPPHVLPVMEYVSRKLSKKSLHITLVVARNSYQLPPTLVSPLSSPTTSSHTTTTSSSSTNSSPYSSSPTSPRLALSSLRQMARAKLRPANLRLVDRTENSCGAMASPTTSSSSGCSPRFWPVSPRSAVSSPGLPLTPSTVSSMGGSSSVASPLGSGCGIRLIYGAGLRAKEERTLQHVLRKAGRRFKVGGESLSPAISAAACGLPNDLINSSILQNEILFSSEGLTLLSLENLYTLKSALSSYSKSPSPLRLEDAVDELRRVVLANGGQKVSKSDLLRSYDWLSVSTSALMDLDSMYRRAYGGLERVGGIEGVGDSQQQRPGMAQMMVMTEPIIWSDKAREPRMYAVDGMVPSRSVTPSSSRPSSPRTPVLKIRTNFGEEIPREADFRDDDEPDEENDHVTTTANSQPILDQIPISLHHWPNDPTNLIINQEFTTYPHTDLIIPQLKDPARVSAWSFHSAVNNSPRSSIYPGPRPPNGYDDISPITRGEWGFLTMDEAFRAGRTVAVETC